MRKSFMMNKEKLSQKLSHQQSKGKAEFRLHLSSKSQGKQNN
jgi:hypothetical protein